jgi:predicted nucleic acid-binding protein
MVAPVCSQFLAASRAPSRGVRDHPMAYYDAQIRAVAKLNQVPVPLSEDFKSGGTLEGVHFLNLFDAGFNLASL